MTDRLAAPADLGTLLGVPDLDPALAALLVEIATSIVQSATGRPPQRILAVADEEITLTGTTDSWLQLPQLPVTVVASVALDGVTLSSGVAGSGPSTWRLRGSRLWRGSGWQTYVGEPSEVTVVYSHGYATGHQGLELARSAVLGLCRAVPANREGLSQLRVDDFSATYDAMAARMEASPALQRALQWTYGHAAGAIR